MILFGRSLFGGPALGRIIAAEGAVACTSAVTGNAKRTAYPLAPYPKAACAATAGGRCEKVVSRSGATGAGVTAIAGRALALFYGRGVRGWAASVTGHARVDFFDGCTLGLTVQLSAAATKTYRPRPAGWCWPKASGVADADLYAIGESIPRLCSAHVFGTTYQVGKGTSAGTSAAAGDAQRIRDPGVSPSRAASELAAKALAEFEVAGSVQLSPTLIGEPAQYIYNFYQTDPPTGALVVDASGVSRANALVAASEPATHSVSLAVGRSNVVAFPARDRRARGAARTASSGFGEGVIVVKAEAGGVLLSTAGGTGVCDYIAGGISVVQATGAGAASAQVHFAAASELTIPAQVAYGGTELIVRATAQAVAAPSADTLRSVFAVGASTPEALTHSAPVLSALGLGTSAASARGAGYSIFWPKKEVSGAAVAVAALEAAALFEAFAQSEGQAVAVPQGEPVFWPKQLVSGAATATATLTGFNTVNSHAFAHASRVVVVARSEREVTVPPQERQITVGRSARAMAA